MKTARDYAIFTVDAEGLIETWPAGAESVFGWIAAEAVGQPYSMTFTPEDRTWGIPEAELRTAREKGQAPNVRVRPLTDTDGAVTGYVKVGQDITERRATEEALRASETRLRLAIGAGRIGEWELDVVTDTSVRAFRHDQIFGYDEPIGDWSVESFVGHVVPEDRPRVEAAFRHAVATATGWHFEYRIRGRTMARYAGSQPTASRTSGWTERFNACSGWCRTSPSSAARRSCCTN